MAYSSDDTPTSNTSGSSTEYDQKADEGVTEYLLRLSIELVEALNERTYADHPVMEAHLAAGWRGQFDYGQVGALRPGRESGTAMTHNEHLEANRKVFATYPQHNIKIVDANTSLDRGMKKGTVFMNIAVSGAPPGTTREGITQFEWSLTSGTWLCVKHTAMISMGTV
ncbi:hypothetical protein HII31_08199 [Pseudocercospora fuligena]|uniref:Uncharacterized protein n=1 Tax=Pseudocercospora fuligena TaxID=685502 RepID=A0A8H6RER2_9PEZI|nr:hypothetical protein HII31_08199 [Pseudocercospora fuligena]